MENKDLNKKAIESYDFKTIKENINLYFEKNKTFLFVDILPNDTSYAKEIYKGYFIRLIEEGYIEVLGFVGNNRYYYKTIKKIVNNFKIE